MSQNKYVMNWNNKSIIQNSDTMNKINIRRALIYFENTLLDIIAPKIDEEDENYEENCRVHMLFSETITTVRTFMKTMKERINYKYKVVLVNDNCLDIYFLFLEYSKNTKFIKLTFKNQ